ncbi:hypothetical protein BJF92_14060 [Rhizobium rhizosphaerae]|uniref:DUF3168 domain-containing protein n=1 Tax=Xaviernesmea rhizosphaerae TaxID=1672749 RepID=A0A1Q9AI28_9HYPH|nr:DUF3168 domain-containing protein [Xaviernesmea rhizosphaerae]OLP54919.1 hypothetical protein BJF92_14060 [Xaviernesmea rhizosphaerae]
MSAAGPLQAALVAYLSADAPLTALIGAHGICDRLVPATTPRPYLRILDIDSRDISGDLMPLWEHGLRLLVVGPEGGHRVVETVAARLRLLLDNAALTLNGHHLASLACQSCRIRRDETLKGHVAELTLRAVTEPA